MADTKISDLTAVVTPATTDEFAVAQGGVSKKMTLAQVKDFSLGSGDLTFEHATDTKLTIKEGASDDGILLEFQNNSGTTQARFEQRGTRWVAGVSQDLRVTGRKFSSTGADVHLNAVNSRTATSGDSAGVEATSTFAPTSGSGVFSGIKIGITINQTGGASGITRGLWINPTITAAADFRALEVTAGKALFGAEVEIDGDLNHDGSNVGFFGTAPAAQQVSGANLTNNVTAGGTNDQIDNWTDLSTYATDAAAIRNAVHQLARKLKQVNDGLRNLGLLT